MFMCKFFCRFFYISSLQNQNYFEKIVFPKIYGNKPKTVISAISCGATHFAAIGEGSLFTWGKGKRGQLGLGTTIESATPRLVGKSNVFVFVYIFSWTFIFNKET